jgi:phage terminase large subunit-like protein
MDYSKLTREQKLELIAALEEKKRRDLLAKPKYQPNAGQLPVHQSKKDLRFVFSGNGAGKTTLLVNEIHWAATGVNPITGERSPVPAKIILVVDNSKKIDEVVLPEWRKWHLLKDEWLRREGKPYTSKIVYDNGSTISIYSAEADPMSFEGVQATHVFVDEPISRNLYVALRRSLRIKNMPKKLLFCGTAISEAWLRRDIYEPWSKGELFEAECFRVGTESNADNLPPEYISSFSRALTQEEKEVRLGGGFFDAGSLALAHLWKRDVHIVKSSELRWDSKWPVVIGIDPHPVKKHVAVMIGATPDNELVVLKELSRKATAEQFAKMLIDWFEGYTVADIVCDSLGSTEGTGNEGFNTFIEVVGKVLAKYRMPGIRPTRYEEKSHEDLIDRLQTGLLIPDKPNNFGRFTPKLRVAASCTGVIENIESVGWQKNRNTGEYLPKLDTSAKDYLSALGYALAANVHFNRGNEKPISAVRSTYGFKLPSQKRSWRRRLL